MAMMLIGVSPINELNQATVGQAAESPFLKQRLVTRAVTTLLS